MEDLLLKCLNSYKVLMDYRYYYVLGHKNKTISLTVEFPKDSFFHLAGLHKSGFAVLANRKGVFQAISDKKVTQDMFIQAGYSLEDRWQCICGLKDLLEDNRTVFRYRGHEHPGSRIEADFLISDPQILFFICDGKPASIFAQSDQGYERGCPPFKVLQLIREYIPTDQSELIYKSTHYHQ